MMIVDEPECAAFGRERIVLARLLSNIDRGGDGARPAAQNAANERLIPLAQALHSSGRQRQKRPSQRSAHDLLSNPAWDMLLNLYVQTACGQPVSVSDSCAASAAPASVALRQLDVIARHGLVARHQGSSASRSTMLALSPDGLSLVEEVLGDFSQVLRRPE